MMQRKTDTAGLGWRCIVLSDVHPSPSPLWLATMVLPVEGGFSLVC